MNRRTGHSLLAVLLGNVVYFSIQGWLPPAARHAPYRIDWGLAVDFWFCVAAWGFLNFFRWFRS